MSTEIELLYRAFHNIHETFCQTKGLSVVNCLCWSVPLQNLFRKVAKDEMDTPNPGVSAPVADSQVQDEVPDSNKLLTQANVTTKPLKKRPRPEKRLKIHSSVLPCRKNVRLVNSSQNSTIMNVTCRHCTKKNDKLKNRIVGLMPSPADLKGQPAVIDGNCQVTRDSLEHKALVKLINQIAVVDGYLPPTTILP